jgi:hypothetical protein
LAVISKESHQTSARIKHSIKSPTFPGNPGRADARKADRYIYNGSLEISELKHEY